LKQKYIINDDYEILTPNGWEDFDGVINNKYPNGMIGLHLIFENGEYVKCTPEHNFFINGKKIQSKLLMVGDILDSSQSDVIYKISDIQEYNMNESYDIYNTEKHIFNIGNLVSTNCDEFAFVSPSIAEKFYHSLYPTLSASTDSKFIITSTANGLNQFSKIFQGAYKGENGFTPHRVDWWEIPGRDEAWKEKEIKGMGSVEAFEQEYGNRFVSEGDYLADDKTQKFLSKIKRVYTPSIDGKIHSTVNNEWLTNYNQYPGYVMDTEDDNRKYIISVDFADGIGRDFTIVNVFEVTPLSPHQLKNPRLTVENEYSLFGLTQVAMWRSNKTNLTDFSEGLGNYIFDYHNHENVLLIVEVNDYRWEILNNVLKNNTKYDDSIYLCTKHRKDAKDYKVGVKLNRGNKNIFFNTIKRFIDNRKIKINESTTIEEFNNFGITKNGDYVSQTGNDDAVMSLLNIVPVFESEIFFDFVTDIFTEAFQQKFEMDADLILDKFRQRGYGDVFLSDILKDMSK